MSLCMICLAGDVHAITMQLTLAAPVAIEVLLDGVTR